MNSTEKNKKIYKHTCTTLQKFHIDSHIVTSIGIIDFNATARIADIRMISTENQFL